MCWNKLLYTTFASILGISEWGFRKLKAGIKNEETGAEGIEPIVKGSHKIEAGRLEKSGEKKMAHRGMDINGLIWSELFIGRGVAAAVAEEKPRKARAGAKVTTDEGTRGRGEQ